jgi:hypothetical protein
VTVTASQVKRVQEAGFQNVSAMAAACDETKCPFYLAVAMFDKESNGANIYGHDKGGAMNYPGESVQVTRDSYAVFRWLVDKGIPVQQPDGSLKIVKYGPNGIGPGQITHPDLVARIKSQGLDIVNPADNILFSTKLLYGYYRYGRDEKKLGVRDSIKYAGTRYNGNPDYGVDLLEQALKWKERVGDADYT